MFRSHLEKRGRESELEGVEDQEMLRARRRRIWESGAAEVLKEWTEEEKESQEKIMEYVEEAKMRRKMERRGRRRW